MNYDIIYNVKIKCEDIVIGDIVILEAGDVVPADLRLITTKSLKIQESTLTGESVPANKHTDALTANANGDVSLGDRKNMVYMGSTVVYGRGKAVITATGMDTEMGKIADALAQAEEGKTPLQIKLAGLSKILTSLVIGICVFIFGFQLIKTFLGGSQGGGQQIAARIACNEIDMLLMFGDPLNPKEQEPKINSLLRLCDVHNVPVATNIATAEVIITALDRGDLSWREIYNPRSEYNQRKKRRGRHESDQAFGA